MTSIETGTICIKTTGREAGKKAVVVKKEDKNFVIIEGVDGSGVRKRKCNIAHLIPISKGNKSK